MRLVHPRHIYDPGSQALEQSQCHQFEDHGHHTARLNADIGLPGSLGEMGLSEDLIEDMVPHAVSDLATMTNPKKVCAEDYVELYKLAM